MLFAFLVHTAAIPFKLSEWKKEKWIPFWTYESCLCSNEIQKENDLQISVFSVLNQLYMLLFMCHKKIIFIEIWTIQVYFKKLP